MLLDEAKNVLAKAGYKMVQEKEELQESFRNFKKHNMLAECGDSEYYEDDAEAAGIAYTDDEEFGECPVCVICGKECCDDEGEYSEDGDFVCADCAQNTEQEMIDLDPMSFWDNKIPDSRTPRARQLDDMAEEDFDESCHQYKYGRKLYEDLEAEDKDYYAEWEAFEDRRHALEQEEGEMWDNCPGYAVSVKKGLSDEDYIDPEENLYAEEDDPIEDYNGEEGLSDEDYIDPEENLYAEDEESLGESCSCGKKGCSCGGKKSKKKGKKGKSNKGWVPYWMFKKGKDKDED